MKEMQAVKYLLIFTFAMIALFTLMRHCRDSVVVECMSQGIKLEVCEKI